MNTVDSLQWGKNQFIAAQSSVKQQNNTGQSFDNFFQLSNDKLNNNSGARDRKEYAKQEKPGADKDHQKEYMRNKPVERQPRNVKTEKSQVAAVESPVQEVIQAPPVESPMVVAPEDMALVSNLAALLNVEPDTLLAMMGELNLAPQDLLMEPNVQMLVEAFEEAGLPLPVVDGEMPEAILQLAKDTYGVVDEETTQTNQPETRMAQQPVETKGDTPVFSQEKEQSPVVVSLAEEDALTDQLPERSERTAPTPETSQTTKGEGQTPGDGIGLPVENFEEALEETPEIQPVAGNTVEQTANKGATVATEALRHVNPQEVIQQVIDNLKVEIRGNISEVKMTLRPESLGEVSLKIATDNGIITAQFLAESQRVKEIIESNMGQLKDLLQEKGLEVSQLSVFVNTGESGEAQNFFQQEQGKSAKRVSQIIGGIMGEGSESAGEVRYVTEADVSEASVEYQA